MVRPYIPMLAENNVRVGFFERESFEAVRAALPEALRPVATFAYLTGWRIPSEVLTLRVAADRSGSRDGAAESGVNQEQRRQAVPLRESPAGAAAIAGGPTEGHDGGGEGERRDLPVCSTATESASGASVARGRRHVRPPDARR